MNKKMSIVIGLLLLVTLALPSHCGMDSPYEEFISARQYFEYIKEDLDSKPLDELEFYLDQAHCHRDMIVERIKNEHDIDSYDESLWKIDRSIYWLDVAIERRGEE